MPSESEPTKQSWYEISVAVDAEAAEAVSALFEQYGEGGAVLEEVPVPLNPPVHGETAEGASVNADKGVSPSTGGLRGVRCVAKAFIPADEPARLEALQRALWHLGRIRPLAEPQVRELGPQDWAEAWKAGYHVISLGRCLRIVPSWIPYTAAPGEVVITLDPGMAFGTGLHPSTQLCLMALEDLVQPGMRILDVGTGSGILAIAAAKLGAVEVLALDVEAVAVRTARENVELNGVGDVVHVLQGSVDDTDRGVFDGVAVNILAEVIARMSGDLARHVDDDGWLVAAGIIESRLPAVEHSFAVAGLDIARRWQIEDWVALEARLKGREGG